MKKTFIQYGTAGFRSRAENLETVIHRVGMLAVLRSKKKNGQVIGLMITASHNPECDNGVKLIDPFGEMLEQSWECLATTLANAENEKLETTVTEIVQNEQINMNTPAYVYIGRDTRSSSLKLSEIAIEGIKSLNGAYKNYGVVTTPVLHYMVYCKNTLNKDPNEQEYNEKLFSAFKKLNNYRDFQNYKSELMLDGANGVGALKVKELLNDVGDYLKIRLYNDGNGILNHNCGADFVKVQKKPSDGVPVEPNTRCVSLDGDADRLIYYFVDGSNKFHMMDGDKIAILIAGYLIDLIRLSKLDINLGLVQTAYANGSSTDYITNVLKIPVACVPTGVKHLHHKALEFDIGVYFEANGHGSVLYSRSAESKIKEKVETTISDDDERNAVERLSALIDLTNQTVGDALSDVLLVETILKARGWNLSDWESTYEDLPNRLLKVSVKDRNVIKTDYTERICLNPPGLQDNINKLVANVQKGRSFIRASGTENVVRVYSEASTQEEADKLGLEVAAAVYQLAAGIGDLPRIQ